MRSKIVIKEVGEVKTGTGKNGPWSLLPFTGANEEGKVLKFQTFKQELFEVIRGNKTLEIEYEEKQREYEGNPTTDRSVFQVYLNGQPVIQKKSFGGRPSASPEERASIESQVAFKGIIDLACAGVLKKEDALLTQALAWAGKKLNGVASPTSPPPAVAKKEKEAEELFPGEKTTASATVKPPPEDPKSQRVGFVDVAWLSGVMEKLHWQDKTLISWVRSRFKGLDCSGKMSDVLERMTKEQAETFTKEVSSLVEASGK